MSGSGVDVRLLGPIELTVDGRDVPVPGRREATVLALLATDAGRVVSVDALIDALYGDEPPKTADKSLQSAVSMLRGLLGAAATIERVGRGYRLAIDPVGVDLHRFDAAVATARATPDPRAAAAALDEALEWWRADDPPDFGDTPAADAWRRDLVRRRLDALDAAGDAHRRAGASDTAIARAEALLRIDPHRATAWTTLLCAFADAGRVAEATAAYQRCRMRFVEDLGLDPPDGLQELDRQIVQGRYATGPTTAPPAVDPPPAVGRAPSPLPLATSSFIGREAECAAIAAALDDNRLVALIGPGGAGKTRLAVEAVRAWVATRPMVTVFVDLNDAVSGSEVAAVVADALGAERPPGVEPLDAAVDRIGALAGDGDVLVVLDNCEHVLDAAAAVVDELLRRCAAVRVVSTSRVVLGVEGERVVEVAPLPVASGGAATLLVERAALVGVELDDDDAAVLALCERVDGLPLAIELLAPQLRTFPLDEVSRRLDGHGLADTARRSGGRRRSMTGTIRWSYSLLPAGAREVALALAAFEASADVDDLAWVAHAALGVRRSDVEQALPVLVEHSLARYEPARVVGDNRSVASWAMLRVVREGLRVIADEDDRLDRLLDAHAERLAARFVDLTDRLWTAEEGAAMVELDRLLPDLRASLDRAITRERLADVVAIAANTFVFGMFAMRGDVLAWPLDAVDRLGERRDDPGWVELLGTAAITSGFVGRVERALALATTGRELVVTGRFRPSFSLEAVAVFDLLFSGQLDPALERFRAIIDQPGVGDRDFVSVAQPVVQTLLHSHLRADGEALLVRAEEVAARLGSPSLRASLELCRAELVAEHDVAAALARTRAAIAQAEAAGNRFVPKVGAFSMATYVARAGDVDTALDVYADVLGGFAAGGSRQIEWNTIRNLVVLLGRIERFEEAVVLSGAASVDPAAVPPGGDVGRATDELFAAARAHAGTDAVAAWLARGEAMPVTEGMAYARSVVAAVRADRAAARSTPSAAD